MNSIDKANAFKALHQSGSPVVLYNIWDAGGAKALAKAGASAVATGSWSVAAAHGFKDGEVIPLDFLVTVVERIVQTVDLPVSVDFEGGYSTNNESLKENVLKIIRAGAVGINFEDRIVQGEGLHPVATQASRIKAIRDAANSDNVPLVINARTDLFLGSKPDTHEKLVDEAIERAAAYTESGADVFFVPGLTDTTLIKQIVSSTSLPVNIMMQGDALSIEKAAELGVGRISYGPGPYATAISDLKNRFQALK